MSNLSNFYANSYFCKLPNEILIKILKQIDTLSLFNFCEIYQSDFFLQDKNITKTINLCKQYEWVDLGLLKRKLVLDHIKVLNINCLYWIPAFKLRNFILKLVNLEELYAISTSLGFKVEDLQLYKQRGVKKLAFSATGKFDNLITVRVPSVEALYVQCTRQIYVNRVFPNARKVWIDCDKELRIRVEFQIPIKRLVLQTRGYSFAPVNYEEIMKLYYCGGNNQCKVMCFDENAVKKNYPKEGPWEVLEELRCCSPYGPKDSYSLHTGENLETIRFQELYFNHIPCLCVEKLRSASKYILKMPCSRNLKKLYLTTCLMENDSPPVACPTTENGFSRKRIGLETSAKFHSLEATFNNISSLQDLEVVHCTKVLPTHAIQAFPLISMFTKLLKLTIDVPPTLDGSFLIKVLEECALVEVLKITTQTSNEKLNFNVCKALPLAKNLKDFKYENSRILIDRIITQLLLIKSQKLQRLMLVCTNVEKFSKQPFKEFLDSNPQLIFLYFVIRQDFTSASIQKLKQTLNIYKKAHPQKIFLIHKEIVDEMTGFPVPNVHYCEMVRSESDACKMNAFEDFSNF